MRKFVGTFPIHPDIPHTYKKYVRINCLSESEATKTMFQHFGQLWLRIYPESLFAYESKHFYINGCLGEIDPDPDLYYLLNPAFVAEIGYPYQVRRKNWYYSIMSSSDDIDKLITFTERFEYKKYLIINNDLENVYQK